MSRHIRGLDISIRGDELEQHRIQLENNLQYTEPSYRLSSVSDEEDHESLEYPRHNSGPAAFPSFEIPSRDHFDGESHSQIHPWSYRTVDDDEGINPYGGETMSTAAHHASALTLNAGLGGGRAGRREVSLSGAEYDPDRPLHDMIAGADSKLSVFDIEPSRSKYPGLGTVTYDPLVVDSTAELDRVLQSGRHIPPGHIQSPLHSSSSSSASESEQPTARPKLSDALRRVSFSPQRPRSNAGSPRSTSRQLPNTSENQPTPKAKKRTSIFPSYTPQQVAQPQVRLQPPTPSSAGSQFSKMARGITREIEQAQAQGQSSRQPERNPFDTSTTKQPTPRKASAMKQRPHTQTPRGKVQLPDVTGLTSAVESPAKMGSEYYAYRSEGSPRENEGLHLMDILRFAADISAARLMGMLNSVQSKLQHLEDENGISRRRVRELELELEVCKRDVARERTRVIEREEVIVQQQRDASVANLSGFGRRNKGKARAKELSVDHDMLNERYREAVEEKKALEALITTLRAHLTRLTAELSSHRELLTELRELRDSDIKALKQKTEDIERLKEEVERLGGEVEVLRGVVEEGLKERRTMREVSGVPQSDADIGMSQDVDEEEDEEDEHAEIDVQSRHEDDAQSRKEEEEEPEPFDPVSIMGSSRNENTNTRLGDRTMRTDHATIGSSHLTRSQHSTPPAAAPSQLIDSIEFERISAEVEERRSAERSAEHAPQPTRPSRRATVQEASDDDGTELDDEEDSRRRGSPLPSRTRAQALAASSSSRSPVSTPARSAASAPAPSQRQHRSRRPADPVEETPFPQIRGTHLERLFFSAPEHNAKTCTVCHRRRPHAADEDIEPSWVPSRFRGRGAPQKAEEESNAEEDDEGFAEGSEQHHDHARDTAGKRRAGERVTFSKEPGPWREQAQRQGLPPQTVVARVIRELEDDFTHYKG
ncbi:hypothetical protein DXG03_007705, partial [Asterophora parasitica]